MTVTFTLHAFYHLHTYSEMLAALILLIAVASAEVPAIGNCPRVNVIRNFDVSRFFGMWYEICAYPSKLTLGGQCTIVTFAWGSDRQITVYTKHVSFGKEKKFLGTATVVGDGVLGVDFPAYRKSIDLYV